MKPWTRWAVASGALSVALTAGWLGHVRVGEGEVVARVSGGIVREVLEAGHHFRLPFSAEVVRLPRTALGAARDFRLASRSGEIVTLALSGQFRAEKGDEAAFASARAGRAFLDAVFVTAEGELAAAARERGAEQLVSWQATAELADRVGTRLRTIGVAAAAVRLDVPPEANRDVLARVQESVAGLARPTGRRVMVVGWDGADWLMVRPLLAQGRLPNLKRLIERGAAGELRASPPLLSPLIWTTMATGKPVTEHGVADFLVKEGDTLVPIGSQARRVHALWTILPTFGLRTAVVAWWATWPAEPTLGVMVSDRVAYQLFQVKDTADENKVYPPHAWNWVREALVPVERIGREDLLRFIDVRDQEVPKVVKASGPRLDRVTHLRKILATTRSYQRVALSLLEEQPDLSLFYNEGTDTVGHLFARFLPPLLPGVGAEDARRFGRALPEFYAYADELLGQLLAKADSNTTVIVVSDHGFFTGAVRPADDPDVTAGAPQWHRQHGIFVAAGPGVREGERVDATPLDLAPTVLGMLGLPIAKDMTGQALFGTAVPGRPLDTYQVLPRPARPAETRSAEVDQERLRELAALGYISTNVAGPPAAGAAGMAKAQSNGTSALSTEAYNLGRILQQKGELDGAEKQFRIAVERTPSFGTGHASLAQALSLQGRHSEAFDVLRQALQVSSTLPLSGLTGLVEEARHANRLDEAAAALDGAAREYREKPAFRAALGLLAEGKKDSAAALGHYLAALDRDPLDQLSLERTVSLLRESGRETEARAALQRAMPHARHSLGSLNFLGVVCLRQRWGAEGEQLFRQILESDPGNAGVLANLSASLAMQGLSAEAASLMSEAVRRDPDNAQNRYNLGTMLAGLGRHHEALQAFEAAHGKGMAQPAPQHRPGQGLLPPRRHRPQPRRVGTGA